MVLLDVMTGLVGTLFFVAMVGMVMAEFEEGGMMMRRR